MDNSKIFTHHPISRMNLLRASNVSSTTWLADAVDGQGRQVYVKPILGGGVHWTAHPPQYIDSSSTEQSAHSSKVTVHATQRGKTHDIVASLEYDEITDPTAVLDGNGNIKLWYLPGAIDHIYQKDVWDSLNVLRAPLEESLKKSRTHGWRNDQLLFRETADITGSIDLSPGWYQQGHGPPNFHPEVSRLLKSGRDGNGAWQWVDQMSECHSLLSGTLAVIHPRMYAAGREALIRLDLEAKRREDTDMSSILPSWNTVYNSVSIMVNRCRESKLPTR
ncbi:hypothetical protein BKA83DRAFT_4497810 [Pisolithus microcarpus]|nr:hypothetical protein BKA83DRAFT_4497810 [Pisolithus microcarpus]